MKNIIDLRTPQSVYRVALASGHSPPDAMLLLMKTFPKMTHSEFMTFIEAEEVGLREIGEWFLEMPEGRDDDLEGA